MAVASGIMGMGVSAVGDIQAGDAEAKTYEFNAGQLRLQANEVERRNYINSAIEEKQGEQYISKQASAFSSNGIDVSSSGSLDFLAEQHAKLGQQLELNRQQSVFETDQMRGQADSFDAQAFRTRDLAQTKAIGRFASLGSFLSQSGGS